MTKAAQIREMLAKGIAAKDIAQKLKVTKQAVYNIAWQDKKKKERNELISKKRGRPAKSAVAPVVTEPKEIPLVQQYRNRIDDLEKERRQFIAELRATDRLCSDLVQANMFLLKLMQKDAAPV